MKMKNHLYSCIRILRQILLTLLSVFIVSQIVLAGVDDYPQKYKNKVLDAVTDEWNFYNRECTSFVAWRLNNRNGIRFTNQHVRDKTIGQMNHAKYWGENAKKLGFAVNMDPQVGSVAWSSAGKYGHVAWVEAVDRKNKTVTVEEYNYKRGIYSERTVAWTAFNGYIHFRDIHNVSFSINVDNKEVQVGDSLTLYKGQNVNYHVTLSDVWFEGFPVLGGAKSANEGILIAKNNWMKAKKTGKSQLLVASEDPNYKENYTRVINVNVVNPKIELNGTYMTMFQGKKATLKATVFGSSQKVTWSSSNKSVASVNSSGRVTAKKAGTAYIYAKANGKTAKCKITVKKPVWLKLSKTALNLNKGKTYKLKATSSGLSGSVKWSTSNKKVATVKNGTVKAVGAGTAVITARRGSKKAACKVTVQDGSAAAAAKKAYKAYWNKYSGIYKRYWVKDYTGDGVPELLLENRYGKYFLYAYHPKGWYYQMVPLADGDTIAVNKAKRYIVSYDHQYGNRYCPMQKKTFYGVTVEDWSVTTYAKFPSVYKTRVFEHYSNGYYYTMNAGGYRNVSYTDAKETVRDVMTKAVQSYYKGTVTITP